MDLHTFQSGALDARYSVASILASVRVPPEERVSVRRCQAESIERLGVVMVLANLLNAALVLLLTAHSDTFGLLSLWSIAVFITSGLVFLSLSYRKRNPDKPRRTRFMLRRFEFVAAAFGCLWAVPPLLIMPAGDSISEISVAIVLTSIVFGASLTLSRLPSAFVLFCAPVVGSLVWSVLNYTAMPAEHLMGVAVMYVAALVICVRWNHNLFLMEHVTRSAVGHQSALIGLLLRDFDESTSDWLWQTTSRGMLIDLPLSMKGGKDAGAKMQKGLSLVTLFEPGEARNVLSVCLERGTGFRDLVMQVAGNGDEKRWWSLTGKPLLENGKLVGFRGVASDVTSSKESEDRIAYMAHYDGMTGLLNRASFQEHLVRACAQPTSEKHIYAVVLMDLDNFKWVNDTLGHAAGDELLRQLGARLTRSASPGDVVARLGGDEFALILMRASRKDLRDSLDDLIAMLAEPYDIWGSTANCGASLGVRAFKSGQDDTQALLTQADLALYQAKRGGKGNWCHFTPALEEKARTRRMIENDLHTALGNDELYLEFQPILNLATGMISSCETLIRWEHPTRGLIMPGEFIQHAEDCGLITRLGDWVIRQALAEARQLPPDVRLSVNISPLQLHSVNLMSTIMNALAQNQIAPSRLDLEITESVLLSDTDFVLERLIQLRKLGLSLSLDDFGTGFSSLSYLRAFPFDKIKIDKSFVFDLETNEDSQAITRATIGLAKSLGLKCTAEGVESEAQRAFLEDLGCDEIQGFVISRARRLEELSELMTLVDGEIPFSPAATAVPAQAASRPKLPGLALISRNKRTG